MLQIPLQAVPSQIVVANLSNQISQIAVYQKLSGLYVNLSVNNALIIGGVIAEDRNRIVRSLYLGFIGDLMFLDNQGTDDPFFEGLGARFTLMYLEASDLPTGQG